MFPSAIYRLPMITKLNNDYFSKENIKKFPERLVIIGFIAADGCISIPKTGQQRLVFNICKKDKISLDIINRELSNGKRNLSFNQTTKSYTITFTSNEICNDLKQYNIIPRKTASYDLDIKQMSYFLRGYFYGDGCIRHEGKGKGCFLIGNKTFITSLQTYLIANNILEKCNVYSIKNSEYLQMCIYGRMAARISKFMFTNKKLNLLPRKHHIIKEIINEWTNEEKELLLKTDITEFCKITGRNIKSVERFKWRLNRSNSSTYGTRTHS